MSGKDFEVDAIGEVGSLISPSSSKLVLGKPVSCFNLSCMTAAGGPIFVTCEDMELDDIGEAESLISTWCSRSVLGNTVSCGDSARGITARGPIPGNMVVPLVPYRNFGCGRLSLYWELSPDV